MGHGQPPGPPGLLPTDPQMHCAICGSPWSGFPRPCSWWREACSAPGFTGFAQLCLFIYLRGPLAILDVNCWLLLLAAGPEPCRPYTLLTHGWVFLSHVWRVQGHTPSFEIWPCFKKCFMLSSLAIFTLQGRVHVCLKVN